VGEPVAAEDEAGASAGVDAAEGEIEFA
jgi:hypothetical protein